MISSPIPENETARVAALYKLQILDTEAEDDFDDIVHLASQICDTPISNIAFIDKDRSWFKARQGVDFNEAPRDVSFCAYNINHTDLVVVEDTLNDERFANNPEVNGGLGIRFYAGMPIITGDGLTLGQLCVFDYKPKSLSAGQITSLRILGKQIVKLLQSRLQALKLREAEQASKNSEQMNTIFHNAIDAIVLIDDEGLILQWNSKAESIFGWTADEVIGKAFYETILPQPSREKYLAELRHHKLKSKEIKEVKAVRKNNTEVDIELGISETTIKGQQLFIAFVSDITGRKLATNKLDKQKEFYENILNKLPTDIVVFDPQHKYLFVNPGAIKDEGLRKFIIGKDDFEYAEYRNRDNSVAMLRREQFLQIKNSGKEIRWEDSLRSPDGNVITHLRRLFPVHDENGDLTMVIGFGIDITDRKILEEKQTELVKQLSAQNTQLVDFCNIVSHNLRAPLVNMSMLTKFIEESETEAEQKILISKLNPVIENLHTTFNELVESIQIKQDLEIKSEGIILEDCLKRTLEGLEVEIGKSEAVIEFDFTNAPVIYYPSKYLFSIFHNLVSNALKYQSPKRKPFIQLETKKEHDSIILSIKDNGLGIDMVKHKDNLFKIGKVFHRHPDAKGFGLFMTKTQVEAMNGQIWVESSLDIGTTFFVEFKNQNV